MPSSPSRPHWKKVADSNTMTSKIFYLIHINRKGELVAKHMSVVHYTFTAVMLFCQLVLWAAGIHNNNHRFSHIVSGMLGIFNIIMCLDHNKFEREVMGRINWKCASLACIIISLTVHSFSVMFFLLLNL